MKKPLFLIALIVVSCSFHIYAKNIKPTVTNPFVKLPPTFHPYLNYCTPIISGTPICGNAWIGQVIFDSSINKISSCSSGYSDYSSTDTVKKRAGESISYTIKEGSVDKAEYVNIYIDYNNDGDFEDEGEKVADQVYMNASDTDATGTFVIPILLAPGYYRIRVISDQTNNNSNNPCETMYGEAEDYLLEITQPLYCTPIIAEPCNMWLTNVTIGDINNSSTQPAICNAGGYTDYAADFYTVAGPGSMVNFSLSALGNQVQLCDIYIDYNDDGDFDDLNETVASGILLDTNETMVTGSFSIPVLQTEGLYRLRVKSYPADIFPSPGPCNNTASGEVEDYRIIITCVDKGADIFVTGNQQQIRTGSATPDILNFTDFGNVVINNNRTRTFKIFNPGTNTLNISGITISGIDSAFFTVVTSPATILNAGDSTLFTIQFMPLVAQLYQAVIHINTDDCGNFDYNIAFQGKGVQTLQSYAKVTMIIQGYYEATAYEMKSVAVNQGISASNTDIDSVTIELHHPTNFSLIATSKGMLQTNGILYVNFPPLIGNYYISIKYKNSLETWSAIPVTFESGETTPYDFTNAAEQAYGNNLTEVEYGVWAIPSGDLNADGNIDINDYVVWETNYNNLSSGNVGADMNGDGNVDISDYTIWETNYNNLISSIIP